MDKTKLISMCDFVLYLDEWVDSENYGSKRYIKMAYDKLGENHCDINKEVKPNFALMYIITYAKFLMLKLELWMFVPCDKDGKPLEEPDISFPDTPDKLKLQKEYYEVKDKCIFEGWEYFPEVEGLQINNDKGTILDIGILIEKNVSIGYIMSMGLFLTPSKALELGLITK